MKKIKPPAKSSLTLTPALLEKAAAIGAVLDELYPDPPIPLHHKDPYTLLIAVLLSAKNRDINVNKTTPALFARADNPAEMMKVPVEEIEQLIRLCGLAPFKSKAIHGLSQILVEKYDGQVPASFEALEMLPGVGHKTASVVMSQAFGVPAFPVDTHILRLGGRWGFGDGKNVEKTEANFKALYPQFMWGKLHLQIIYFGREYCPAIGHMAEKCPICSVYGVR